MYGNCDVHHKIALYVVIYSSLILNVFSLVCKNCRAVENPQIRCQPDCTGDICGLWEWEDKATFQLIQTKIISAKVHEVFPDAVGKGCISGLDAKVIRMGCRKNTVGATLCLCNSYDGCNDIERPDMIALMKLINLPDVQCSNRIETPYIAARSDGVCRSNYCFYTRSKNIGIDGTIEETMAAGCGQLQQYIFDVSIHPNWPAAGLFSGGCYVLEDSSNQVTVGCICHNENFCNNDDPFPVTKGQIKCHVSYHLGNVSELENRTCTGHFCRIEKSDFSNFGIRYTKGCVDVNDTMAEVKLNVGYLNILGQEQWYCDEDYCNYDVETAEKSIQSKQLAQVSSVPPVNMQLSLVLLTGILLQTI